VTVSFRELIILGATNGYRRRNVDLCRKFDL